MRFTNCEWMREANCARPYPPYFYRIATIGESIGSPAYAVRKAEEAVEAHMKSFALAMRLGRRAQSISRLRYVEFVMQEGRIARSSVEGVAEELLWPIFYDRNA